MKIGSIDLAPPFALAPMAGMTDTAFRRLVKRQGGCGLVVTEMVSSEGLVRGIDRTLEYAEYTEEERPVSIQIFGGDPEKMAAAAQIVEGMGADIVDVNMGCPVPKIAKHNAGCSLMREPEHAAEVIARDGEGGEDSGHGEDARRLERRRGQRAGAGAADGGCRRRGGRRARPHRGAVATPGRPTGISIARVAGERRHSGVRQRRLRRAGADRRAAARRGVSRRARRPRRAAQSVDLRQAADLAAGRAPRDGHRRTSAGSSCSTTSTCCMQRARARGRRASGTSRRARRPAAPTGPARGHDRWVINKLRALNSWYTKGLDNGSHLRVAINAADSIPSCARSSRTSSSRRYRQAQRAFLRLRAVTAAVTPLIAAISTIAPTRFFFHARSAK